MKEEKTGLTWWRQKEAIGQIGRRRRRRLIIEYPLIKTANPAVMQLINSLLRCRGYSN
jgi:hypothetical protein